MENQSDKKTTKENEPAAKNVKDLEPKGDPKGGKGPGEIVVTKPTDVASPGI
jgi:hypothetical protein